MKPKYKNLNRLGQITVKITLAMLLAALIQIGPNTAQAASLTSMSDTLSRLKASTAANHEIYFVTPTGVSSGGTITLTFSAGFDLSTIVFGDVDLAEGNSGTCSSASYTEKTLVASSPGATEFSAAVSSQVLTFTSGGASATITAARCVRIKIGTNASSGGAGTHQIVNGAIGSSDTMAIATSTGDSGTLAIEIITNDQITVSATVDPTITFTLIDASSTDNAIGFGTLGSGAAKYANAASTGSASDVSAVTMTVATNASSGYVLSYSGDTLKSGSDSIAVATIVGDADGTPGTPQFATGYTTSGSSTIVSGYENTSNNWAFVANTTTPIISRTTPTNTETIGGHYLANIGGATPAGAYSTTITYIATGTF